MLNNFHISPTIWIIGLIVLVILVVILFFVLPPFKEKVGYSYGIKEFLITKPEQVCFNSFKEI